MFRTINLSGDKKGPALAASKAMASTPMQLMKMGTEELGESWIELSSSTSQGAGPTAAAAANQSNPLVASTVGGSIANRTPPELCAKSPDRTTPPLPFASVEEYIRLLREAQRESKESSRVASLTSSRKNSPRGSPKSPPNSPNNELAATEEDLKNVYINYVNKDGDIVKDTDWVWDWSSRPDQQPPKDWKFEHPKKPGQEECTKTSHAGYSIRQVRVGKNSLFSREFLYSIVVTNILSLLLGAGIGAWLQKRGLILTRISIE
ncbi:BCL2/adenovirus E1B 19 kDa protein-interacting protein 3 [Anopheles bellator]|uniref:BCL2/adenovirus E1B 19 kDa protein-interacting protein 3 n=1 Tax=Anopheles bellator TaxID=139047 RepID=UPI00264822D9|nr:BCL2/adenovirus E1B 19 kDa protein-interacting protein 3 [Anopheles bellator]